MLQLVGQEVWRVLVRRRKAAHCMLSLLEVNAHLLQYSVHAWEFSKSQLGRYISRPQCVNKLDWIDLWWPTEEREAGVFPRVQKQVTLSPAGTTIPVPLTDMLLGAFTHFHIDTGGASRWYNVMRGEQILLLVPPTDQSLQAYKDWILKRSTYVLPFVALNCLLRDEKQQVFFPDLVKVTIKCVVKEGETIFVPSGWAYVCGNFSEILTWTRLYILPETLLYAFQYGIPVLILLGFWRLLPSWS